ncbi:MAG: hypothetical protein KA015_06455 [Spirochaetes bacterium]|nr:hypothetical protein [Spirochaetota bacterium]
MKVGLLGFGRTGKMVAQEIVSDDECSLLWVARKSAETLGAIHAAKWITDKSEGLYSMESLINEKIKSHVNKEEV